MNFTDDESKSLSPVFSDEDLNRLKECGRNVYGHVVSKNKTTLRRIDIEALLARLESAEAEVLTLKREREQTLVRLEAAEQVCESVSSYEWDTTSLGVDLLETWRKAKGDVSDSEKAKGE